MAVTDLTKIYALYTRKNLFDDTKPLIFIYLRTGNGDLYKTEFKFRAISVALSSVSIGFLTLLLKSLMKSLMKSFGVAF